MTSHSHQDLRSIVLIDATHTGSSVGIIRGTPLNPRTSHNTLSCRLSPCGQQLSSHFQLQEPEFHCHHHHFAFAQKKRSATADAPSLAHLHLECLQQLSMEGNALDRGIVCHGPGSFTGTRITNAYAQGLHAALLPHHHRPPFTWLGMCSLTMIALSLCHDGAAASRTSSPSSASSPLPSSALTVIYKDTPTSGFMAVTAPTSPTSAQTSGAMNPSSGGNTAIHITTSAFKTSSSSSLSLSSHPLPSPCSHSHHHTYVIAPASHIKSSPDSHPLDLAPHTTTTKVLAPREALKHALQGLQISLIYGYHSASWHPSVPAPCYLKSHYADRAPSPSAHHSHPAPASSPSPSKTALS